MQITCYYGDPSRNIMQSVTPFVVRFARFNKTLVLYYLLRLSLIQHNNMFNKTVFEQYNSIIFYVHVVVLGRWKNSIKCLFRYQQIRRTLSPRYSRFSYDFSWYNNAKFKIVECQLGKYVSVGCYCWKKLAA